MHVAQRFTNISDSITLFRREKQSERCGGRRRGREQQRELQGDRDRGQWTGRQCARDDEDDQAENQNQDDL